ncbi:hypothetical protein [Streptomyces sp. 1222.5]|uniref:hypothetical protein n=1 Tax=Streptomyces sp. 1222.5 TaxID=1881026 RepID=UPI003EBDA871
MRTTTKLRPPLAPVDVRPDPKVVDLFEQAAWASLAADRRAWGVAAHPAPIPLRFVAAPVDFTDTGPQPPDLRGRYGDIADAYGLVASGRLAILGERGSGKTQLARHLGTQLLTADNPAVCVLMSLTGCDAVHDFPAFLEWLARRLPGGSAHEVAAMLGRGQLVPVLDDFDRLSQRERARLLLTLGQFPDSARFVLVAGWDEYSEAVEDTDTVPAGCAAVRIQPVDTDDLDGWIQRGSRRAETKRQAWAAVLDDLRADPSAPAHKVLADPLLAGAARVLFTDGRGDPAELLAPDTDAEALDQRLLNHLLGVFVPRRLLEPDAMEERRLGRLVRRMARATRETGGAVRDMRVLYGGARHSWRSALVHTSLMTVLGIVLASLQMAEHTTEYSGYSSTSTGDSGGASMISALFLAPFFYLSLRHHRDSRAPSEGDVFKYVAHALVYVPAAVVVLVVGPALGLLAQIGLVPAVLLTLLVSRMAARPPYRFPLLDAVGGLSCCCLVLAIGGLTAALLTLHTFLLTTLSGTWLLSGSALTPYSLRRTLDLALHRGILAYTPAGFVFTQPALERWYADTPPPQSHEGSTG